MHKLWLIVQREYITRVRKRSFILATLLTPLAFGLLMFASGYFASKAGAGDKSIIIKDDSHILADYLEDTKSTKFTFSTDSLSSIKNTYAENGYDLALHVPALKDLSQQDIEVSFYSSEKPSLITLESLERKISRAIEAHKMEQSPIQKETIEALKMDVTLENAKTTDSGVDGDASSKLAIGIATGLSYVMGFLMYMVIFFYGNMVMRSVMEEKINRIVEVMISSVKPFYLMLGKIIGVGLVGLTQLSIWIVLIPSILFIASSVLGIDTSGAASSKEAAELMQELQGNENSIQQYITEFMNLNWMMILPSFIIYFLGGYFIYSSLFAAVGSAIGDDLGEGQQLTLPIIIPVIFAMMIIPAVFNNPDGPLAVGASMFPLFSPIIMPARLPFDPPIWQLLLSIVILIASVGFFAWLSGRIYRVGIFMYGKKVNFKEIWKWMFYKG